MKIQNHSFGATKDEYEKPAKMDKIIQSSEELAEKNNTAEKTEHQNVRRSRIEQQAIPTQHQAKKYQNYYSKSGEETEVGRNHERDGGKEEVE